MRFFIGLMLGLCVLPVMVFSATYEINTNSQGEGVLNRAIAAGGSHDGLTKQQVLQRNTNQFLRGLNEQQARQDQQELNMKIEDATGAARNNADAALIAGITPPSVTNPGDQTSPVNVPLSLTIAAIDPDLRPLTMTATNLPAGLTINGLTISGTPTTAASSSTTVHVHKYPDQSVTTSVSFTWLVQ